MAKWKRTNTDIENISQKIEQHEHYYKRGRGECTQVIRKRKQFLLHLWHPWCYSCYPVMQKGPTHGGDRKTFEMMNAN
jgi:hypothetical protein